MDAAPDPSLFRKSPPWILLFGMTKPHISKVCQLSVIGRACFEGQNSPASQPHARGWVTAIHEVFNLHSLAWSTFSRQTELNPAGGGLLTTRWNFEPLYPSGLPPRPLVSPVQNCRKFSAVLGTTSGKSSILIRPRGSPDNASQLA